MAIYGHAWPCMARHGHIWPCMAMHGQTWPYMAIHGIKNQKIENKSVKILKSKFPLGAQNCEIIRKTRVSRFLPFYPLIWAFQTLSRIPKFWVWRDLSFGIKNSWFHALWLGIQPFLCLNPWKSLEIHGNPWKSMEIHGNPCRITRSTLQNLICYRMSVSRASGTPCGSVFGRFCVSRFRIGGTLGSIFMKIMEVNGRKVKNRPQKRHIDVEWHL